MNSFGILILAVAISSAVALPSLGNILYQFTSTLNVVNYLCNKGADSITDQLATDFFNCYDVAPAGGKEIYTKCQIEQGAVMNTTQGIQKTCKNLITFPLYAACLAKNFKAAGIDLNTAITDVNKCEEQVLGIAKQ